ncbi:MAG: putative signal transduction histidine kinase [Mucilaginibacter sp.]|nr:putative signal transduction histidine kinase [Mucilaginibacter sp.]
MKNDKSVLENSEQLQMFRKKAENLISRNRLNQDFQFAGMEIEELLHELQVFQIELEMQNDELRISHNSLELERLKFAGLYDLAPVGYFILDKFGAVTEINFTGLTMMEIGRAQIIGRRFQDYVANDQWGDFYNLIRKMRSVNTRHNCQLTISSDKGKVYYAQLEGTGILNPLTAELQFYIAVIDVTSRKQAEQRLIETNERLRMTLEASATGTWEIDLKNQRLYFDENSYSILGLESWAFDGRYETFFKLLHPEDRQTFKTQLLLAVNEEKDLDAEFRLILNLTGLRFVAARGHSVRQDPGSFRFVGIIIDITEKKKLQHEADELRANYQKSIMTAGLQAQEKERKRISDALHDSVAQMLYGIRLSLQNNGAEQSMDNFSDVSKLLNEAITEIRNISFELAPSILTDFGLVESIKEMAKRLNGKSFSVVVKSQGSEERFKPDLEISAFRIIQELINNSIKHGNATETVVKINLMAQCIIISVSDNGTGFNLKTSDYLTRGSGLLSIKNRVGIFNGSFDIRSGIDKGTVVSITLKAD